MTKPATARPITAAPPAATAAIKTVPELSALSEVSVASVPAPPPTAPADELGVGGVEADTEAVLDAPTPAAAGELLGEAS